MRHGAFAAALALTMMQTGMVRKPEMVSHAELERRFEGIDLEARRRGVVGAGHRQAAERPTPQPCTFVRKPGKRALRRTRGKALAA
jgi:hypothetical protein